MQHTTLWVLKQTLWKNTHLHLNSSEAQMNGALFQAYLQIEMIFGDSPARKHENVPSTWIFSLKGEAYFFYTQGCTRGWHVLNCGAESTHRHTGAFSRQADLDFAVQVDHVQADKGEDLHGQTGHAGVSVHQHFGKCVEGAAVETQTRGMTDELNCIWCSFINSIWTAEGRNSSGCY